MKYKIYNKENINIATKRYVESKNYDDFEELLALLEPLIQKILLRHPKYKEHHEDLKQDVMIRLCKNFGPNRRKRKNGVDLDVVFQKNIPSAYFFERIKGFVIHVIPSIDSTFQIRKENKNKIRTKQFGYNHYENDTISFCELLPTEKRKLGIDLNTYEFDDFWGN